MSQLRSNRPKWSAYCANLQFLLTFEATTHQQFDHRLLGLSLDSASLIFADLFLDLGQPCLVTAFKQHKLYNQASLGLREQIGEHSIIVESDYRNSRNKQTLLDSAAQKIETNLLTHSGETCRDFAVVWMCLNKDWSKTSWTRCSLQRWSFPGGTGIGRTHPKLQKPS